MTCAYRVRQFAMRLVARFRTIDDQPARGVLSPSALELFASMPRGDQAHALCVLRELGRQELVEGPLAQAALLHDVGKAGAGLTLVHRSIIVLLQTISGSLVEDLADPDPTSWRHPFYVHLHHADIGARRCQDAGCAQQVIDMVRLHETRSAQLATGPMQTSLRALQCADDRC